MYIKVRAKLELADFSKIRTGSHMKQTRLREGGGRWLVRLLNEYTRFFPHKIPTYKKAKKKINKKC